MQRLVGLSEAARKIGVSPASLKWQLLYGRGVGDVAQRGPSGARLFTDADIERLRTALKGRVPGG